MAAILESIEIPQALLDDSKKKLEAGEDRANTGLFTPESSPGPTTELPKESDDDKTRDTQLDERIKEILAAPDDEPRKVLGVTTTKDYLTKVSDLKGWLEKRQTEDGKAALKKVQNAEDGLTPFYKSSINAIKAVLAMEGQSFAELGSNKSGDYGNDTNANKERFLSLWRLLDPNWNVEEGAEKARQVYEELEAAVKDSADLEMGTGARTDNLPTIVPDEGILAIYAKFTPQILAILNCTNSDEARRLSPQVDSSDGEIMAYGTEKGWSLEDTESLFIDITEIGTILDQNVYDSLAALRKDPSDKVARVQIEEINENLLDFNKKHHYPLDWVIDLPPTPSSTKPPLSTQSSLLAQLLGPKSVSTNIDVTVPPGSTVDGGKIVRYNQYFTPSEKDQAAGKEPRYSFLVMKDGEYSLKSGKDVGRSAIEGYLNRDNKLKMGQYFGEKSHGVKYTKPYFNRLRKLEKKEGTQSKYLLFLGAFRKSATTKTGRTMPQEGCVIYIRDPDLNTEWYDVFTRSVWTKLSGNDAGLRFDEYWKERGEDPSSRKELEDSKSKTSSKADPIQESQLKREVLQIRRELNELKSVKDDVQELKSMKTDMEAIRAMFEQLMKK